VLFGQTLPGVVEEAVVREPPHSRNMRDDRDFVGVEPSTERGVYTVDVHAARLEVSQSQSGLCCPTTRGR